ncbi:hypothetical protein GR160_01645 [Flavobacterium sp. Sd200]|uniref:hypothetical protein n=1 Tax=Flavobacterium sp. Sd200 TaxID=2692211 RepID=UPI001368F7D2|nr:hypothetical protein [Flavobacterium sp. Sd200]MXN89917.1 hypothetical protein [Flavobacterium sp. Sd200]
MKNLDLKHLAFHVLVGLYFIWLAVFGILLYITFDSILANSNENASRLLLMWVSLNFVMGTSIYMVIRLFRNRTVLAKVIFYSYAVVAIIAVATVFLLLNRV